MNWDAISALAEVIGAIAVVVTLLYLAVQIRQSVSATQASSREAVSRYTIDWLMQIALDSETMEFWQGALADSTNLDAAAKLRRDMIAYAVSEGWEMAFMQWQRGVLSDNDWEKWGRVISSYMATPGFKEFWEVGSTNLGSDFKAYVDQLALKPTYDFPKND